MLMTIMCTFCSIFKFRRAICKYGSKFSFIEDGKGAEGVKNMEVDFFLSVRYCVTWQATQEKKIFKKEV